MSIENAILELAAAIRGATTGGVAGALHTVASASIDELEKAVTKVETDAKTEQKKVMALVEADRKSAAKQAVADALAKAEAEKKVGVSQSTINAVKQVGDQQEAERKAAEEVDEILDPTPLDYEKDVKPKLVQVGKNKQEMVDLLASFGVGKDLTYAKADQLPADKFGAVVAACDKILAARG